MHDTATHNHRTYHGISSVAIKAAPGTRNSHLSRAGISQLQHADQLKHRLPLFVCRTDSTAVTLELLHLLLLLSCCCCC
jgi:hypothetical protein